MSMCVKVRQVIVRIISEDDDGVTNTINYLMSDYSLLAVLNSLS